MGEQTADHGAGSSGETHDGADRAQRPTDVRAREHRLDQPDGLRHDQRAGSTGDDPPGDELTGVRSQRALRGRHREHDEAHPQDALRRSGPGSDEQAVPAPSGVLDRRLRAEQVAPGAESSVVVDKGGPLFGGGTFGLDIASGDVVI